MKIGVVNYNMGNVGSIANMLGKIGVDSVISNDLDELRNCDKLILPGVGSFDVGMQNLHSLKLIEFLNEEVLNKKKTILGICLGVQLFTQSSEEGTLKGLSWFDAKTVRFNIDYQSDVYKIPHMGWNILDGLKKNTLFDELSNEARFYFVHSFHIDTPDKDVILCETEYKYKFVSGLVKENIFGVQFHPEKSHNYGMSVLKNFIKLPNNF